jgi:hypothetical protein
VPTQALSPGPALRVLLAAMLAAALLSLTVAAGARATSVEGGNAFNELSQKAQEEPSSTATQTTTASGETKAVTNGSKTILIGIGAAILLLLSVAYVIVRDAKRVAPAGDEEYLERRASRDNAVRLANRRSKAKAARAQRKRNR